MTWHSASTTDELVPCISYWWPGTLHQLLMTWHSASATDAVFKIRSETCRTEAQFCQNLYMIKKESLSDRPKFCRSMSAVRHLFWRLLMTWHPASTNDDLAPCISYWWPGTLHQLQMTWHPASTNDDLAPCISCWWPGTLHQLMIIWHPQCSTSTFHGTESWFWEYPDK